MTENRCPAILTTKNGFRHACGRKLGEDLSGTFRMKCPRCKNIVTIDSTKKAMV